MFACILISLLVGLALGYYYGNRTGIEEGQISANEELSRIVHAVFPKPPAEIFSLSGTVVSVSGATIKLEVRDPDDYLPHTDGSLPRMETRYAMTTGDTEIFLFDAGRVDRNGNIDVSEISASDLNPNDSVIVKSHENIREKERFDVTRIELMKY